MDLCKTNLLPTLGELDDRNFDIGMISGALDNLKSFEYSYKLPIKDQKETMMCVGFSHSYLIEIVKQLDYQVSQYMIYHNRDLNSISDPPFPGYYNSSAEKHLVEDGVCSLKSYSNNEECPDGIFSFMKIKDYIINEARQNKIQAYYDLKSVDEMKHFVNTMNTSTQSAGIVISIAVYESVANVKADGIFPMSNGKLCGYHSMCVVGCDDKYIKVINSIGDTWGDHGYGYIPINDDKVIQEIKGIVIEGKYNIPTPPKPDILYRVQISANKNKEYALQNQTILASKELTLSQRQLLGLQQNYLGSCLVYEKELYKCQVGSFSKKENAEKLIQVLNELGYKDAWITEYKK